MELSGGNLTGEVFYVGENFYGEVYREGRELFINGEPDLPAIFEKQSEIKL
jgi:hypothetical protein